MWQINDLLAIIDVMFFGDYYPIGDDVIDERHTRSARIAGIIHL